VLRRPPARAGFTVLELMVVLAIILILGAIVGPSLFTFWGNNRTKAAVDTMTARLADARGAAIAQGRPYRVCVSPDGLSVRVCPDESEPAEELATEQTANPIFEQNTLPVGVVVTPKVTGTDTSAADTDGWLTLVVFLPDGTAREDAEFEVAEPNNTDSVPQTLRVRSMTGVWTVNPTTAGTAGTVTPTGMTP
jgi:prepilin-type N-terminal cleavage/methylation domain-containing protein